MDSALGRLSVHPQRLVGWKSIGQFLSCTERTARRWEVYRALPVYRVPGGTRSSVWAHADELAAWLRALPTETRAEMPGLPAAAAAIAGGEPATELPIETAGVAPGGTGATSRRRWLQTVASVVIVSLAAAGVVSMTHGRRPEVPRTDVGRNREAHETMLRARFELATRTPDGLAAAQRDFRRVVELYPRTAAAWSGLADTYLLIRQFGNVPDDAAYPEAAKAARAAINLDPHLADAWLDQAFIAFWWEGDWPRAFRAFETALRLDPTAANAFHWYATALVSHGDFAKSLQMIGRARELDPGNRAIVADEGWLQFIAGYRTQGLATLERMVKIDPSFLSWHAYLARAYLVLSRDADFLREARLAAELRGQADALASLDVAERQYLAGGRAALLDQLTASATQAWEHGAGSPVVIARYRALAGDDEGVAHWLAIAEAQHDHHLPGLRSDPELADYRNRPQVRPIVARLH